MLGFTFFALELVWYRMLGPILGGTAFTFGLILCVALLGIGVGGIAYNIVFSRWRPSWAALAVTCGWKPCSQLFRLHWATGWRSSPHTIRKGGRASASLFSAGAT